MHNWKREQHTRTQAPFSQVRTLLTKTSAAPAATAHENTTPARPVLAVERVEPLRWSD